jgi:hypothetical protein
MHSIPLPPPTGVDAVKVVVAESHIAVVVTLL